MYTREQLVEQVYLAVKGGKLSADVNVKRVDIDFLLPAAFSDAIVRNYYERHNLMLTERRLFGYSDEQKINDEFLTTYEVTPIKDTTRNLCYIPLPATLVNMPGGKGLDSVFSADVESAFVKVTGQEEVIGLEPLGAGFFWFEKYPTESRVYLKAGNCGDCNLFIRMVAGMDGIGRKDIVPIPSGQETRILELMKDWFLDERRIPDNRKNDNIDDAAQG